MNREKMRFQAAVAAMRGILSGKDYNFNEVAREAFKYADALLAELDRTAPKPETPQPDADGWVPHKPGDLMPCDGGLRVHVKYRNGDIDHNDDDPARDWDWDDNGSPYDIIAWKLA